MNARSAAVVGLLLALLAVLPASAETSRQLSPHVRAAYDRFDDESWIETDHIPLFADSAETRPTGLRLQLSFRCSGDVVCDADSLVLDFAYSGRVWGFVEPDTRRLIFIIGNDRMPIPIRHYASSVSDLGVSEWMAIVVPRDLALRLITSNTDGKLGFAEFSLRTPSNVATLDEFAALLRRMK